MNKINNLYDLALELTHNDTDIVSLLNQIDATTSHNIKKEFLVKINQLEFTNTLTDTGLTTEKSFMSELFNRLNEQFFSPLYPKNDLRSFLNFKHDDIKLADILLSLSNTQLVHLYNWLADGSTDLYNTINQKLDNPLRVLTSRLVYYGTTWQIQSKIIHNSEFKNCFYNLEGSLRQFINESSKSNFKSLSYDLSICLNACQFIRQQKSEKGISLDITYRLIKIKDIAQRINEIASLKTTPPSSNFSTQLVRFTKKLLKANSETNNVSKLVFQYLELVFYEITEHTGKVGKKYALADKRGYYQMMKKGAIGGLIVGLLALLKPMFSEFNLSAAGQFFSYGMIYSLIFLLIYFFKGALATKQPAMTASRIAQILDKKNPANDNIQSLVKLIKDIFRIQFIAIAANLLLALPIAGLVYFALNKYKIFSLQDSTAQYLTESLHPFFSGTIVFAILTGFCLAGSGIIAGAIRNWYIYNQIKKRLFIIASNFHLKKRTRLKKYISFFDTHLDGFTSNISLGFLLGFMSAFGKVFGLPLDVRHITFASAQMGISFTHSIDQFLWPLFIITFFSVVAIGIINLLVSFNVTLFIALRSRRISFKQFLTIFKACKNDFTKDPSSYFIPKSLISPDSIKEFNEAKNA